MSDIPREERNDAPPTSPVIEAIEREGTGSVVALVGHPIHAMMVHFPIALVIATLGSDVFYWITGDEFFLRTGLWAAAFAFITGVAAAIAGTAELVFVKGIRIRVASWTHATAAMTLISIMAANWGVRLVEAPVLPHGLALSVLAAIFTAVAGWHGGKLVLDHGVGVMVSPKR
ncbi:DUF2231 domain-containing protein [Roseococcus suduntuyensis]|uniref:Putative membrane protein n=1 Tax=Roseococcus suduntuyensis TaxID=455361 RepID=A0A840ABK2_9PROT|nr:DUF2231 domain-containing protein [Roseococcus suduntuyensis]MBB3898531.1 putative membrane protein [Roseococcus suduntuyensis]